ncbi:MULTISPECIES: TonB-dependent siderophore receptor [unclassified Kaistella]|uniref:TonB-dependent siderophore receptor n=1 Tax=unclassified Kaistella TaxID=2762626 RepID=UPI002732F14B|nr:MULTISPECIES: TonB-dependent siderophore receptor [unclassified Kaistella]MDP2454488.1 TonB-dependent siderophore receptor [Kaistella sp. SH11-4b]MDP2457226.1 TonB-dependent siderophore receptor [Kaistella sp. SH40-3]MDP2459986.1 TonB-dependent siderophore receptor [Kaistella sp. SH19-2b]
MKQKIAVSALVLGGFFAQAQQDSIRRTVSVEEVELFGERNKVQEGLQVITRLPLKTRDQIQSISVVSAKVIEELGGLTVTDVAKNIPGVTQFGSYGGTKESMSIRGYRGVPVLKNGVQMDSDFRTGSMLTDMQGVESIQVIKGSAAVTQGIGNGLGDAGGVINIVTKTPRFFNQTNVGFRYGSWDFYRPTVDFQRVLDSNGKVAVRFNGAYQNSNSFRKYVNTDRIYVNPSISYRPDDKTEIIVEMDYMNNNVTPDRGTVNLADGDTEALYRMPKDKFLGFATDNAHTETFNFATSVNRKLTDKLKLRAAFISSSYESETIGAALAKPKDKGWEYRNRTLTKSGREDLNKVFQFDFIGADVMTGPLKHTFQVGFDWKESNVTTTSYIAKNVDQINVLENINNFLPAGIDGENFTLAAANPIVNTKTPTYGLMAQDVITINKYVKAHLGIRYSRINGSTEETDIDAWNPSLGLMISPIENMNVFGSYTSTTSLRSAKNPLIEGGVVGASNTKQFEAGVKSDWLNQKLRFNVTLFDIKTDNLSYSVLNDQGNATGFFGLAGELRRKGVEVELIGRILPNLQVMTGYAYLDAQYQNSPAYVDGSAPMNSPHHTANGWLNYKFNTGVLNGLDFGAGIYYVGERPVDEFTQKTIITGHANSVTPGMKPFDMPAYTTVDAQAGYTFTNGLGLRVFVNNIFDAIGYSSYFRGGYIDQIQPTNFSAQINYKF